MDSTPIDSNINEIDTISTRTTALIHKNEYTNQTFLIDNSLNIEKISLSRLNERNQVAGKSNENRSNNAMQTHPAGDSSATSTHRNCSLKSVETPPVSSASAPQIDSKLAWRRYSSVYSLILAILATACITFSIFLVKLSVALTASDMAVLKFASQILLCIPFIYYYKETWLGPKELRFLLVGRGLADAISLLAAYFSIKMINFADTITIRYASPILTVLLAHLFLKEKLNISHLVSFLFVLVGIVFIARPSGLFGRFGQATRVEKSFNFILGIGLAVVCALSASSTFIFIKKLIRYRHSVQFTVVILYFSVIGLGLSLLISFVIYAVGFDALIFERTRGYILKDVGIGLMAGLVSFFGQACFNLAITNENTNKISFLKTIDIAVAFLIEYLVLSVKPHWLNLVGAGLIFSSVIFMFLYKFIMNYRKQKAEEQNEQDSDTFEIRL